MKTEVSSSSSGASVALTIRQLALKQIEPSGTAVQERRRAHYDAAALQELARNIKAVQVIEPIIVRPKAGREEPEIFEIVAGERRWRASRGVYPNAGAPREAPSAFPGGSPCASPSSSC